LKPNSSCYVGETQNASQYVKRVYPNDSINGLDDLVTDNQLDLVDSELTLAESQLNIAKTQVEYLEKQLIPDTQVVLAEAEVEALTEPPKDLKKLKREADQLVLKISLKKQNK
jgi:hypothetical protein